MPTFSSRFALRSRLVLAAAVLATGVLLGACDRHSAQDLPESYGHGSGHQKQFDLHEPDSRNGSRHFSDSKGVAPGAGSDASDAAPAAKPGETASSPMFPSGH